MQNFEDCLNVVLEEDASDETIQQALQIAKDLENARQTVSDLNHKLLSIKNRINSNLALSLRRKMPSLNIAIDKNGCKIGYRSKCLYLNPDIEKGIWSINSPDHKFQRSFLSQNRHNVVLTTDPSNIISAIISYFTNYYKSLGENIDGIGTILIENKYGSMIDLVNWNSVPQRINSRLTRQNNGKHPKKFNATS